MAPPHTAPPQMIPSQTAPPHTAPNQMVPSQMDQPQTIFKCSTCPAIKTSLMCMKTHLTLHSGSDSNYIFCETCNYPLLPEKLKQHRSLRHPTTHPTDPTPNPNFPLSPFKKKCKPGGDNKCGRSPATFRASEMLDAHLKLHFQGSVTIVCPEPGCGCQGRQTRRAKREALNSTEVAKQSKQRRRIVMMEDSSDED
ncbi:unnamed protein product [Orchesella dallaii]|uniref:C2H2-type domain-containing protein n=1 Tax=Orchesella dallaii TaxID=48710 RepID=A0ABP1RY12_9HEXA